MATYILVAVFSVSLLTFYLSLNLGTKTELDRIIRLALGLMALHAAQAWTVHVYFPGYLQFDHYMPYGFLYGPCLYFGCWAASGKVIRRRHVVMHGLPFSCFLLGFIWMATFPQTFQTYRFPYAVTFYTALSLSLLGYMLWALLFKGGGQQGISREVRLLISQVSIILAFITAVLTVLTSTGFMAGRLYSDLQGSLVFLAMLTAALVHFFYTVRQLRGSRDRSHATRVAIAGSFPKLQPVNVEQPEGRYQKSAIAPQLLTEYASRLTELMGRQRVFLDEGLTLESLAQRLKIPRHHLSQVLSTKINKNFNTYVNEYRINYAVGLIKTADDLSITDIMYRSGFASKASFNRYFKQFQGCTPSEYRARIRNN